MIKTDDFSQNESNLPKCPESLDDLKSLNGEDLLKLLQSPLRHYLLDMLNAIAFAQTPCNHPNSSYCSDECDETQIAQIAENLLESPRTLEIFESLLNLNLLDDDDYSELAQMLEICPIHLCDYRICIDDEIAECAHLHS